MRLGITLLFLLLSGALAAQEERKPEPPKPPPAEEKKPPAAPVISIQKSTKPDPCIIKPVMSDKELRDCGAHPRQQ